MNTAYHHGTGDPASQLSADLQSAESWEKRTDSVCFAWTKKLSQAGRGRLGLLTQPVTVSDLQLPPFSLPVRLKFPGLSKISKSVRST
jgi:hypothetical protein